MSTIQVNNIRTPQGQGFVFVVESGPDYTKYNDGTMKCWGTTTPTSSSGAIAINLPKPFVDNNYGLSVGVVYSATNWASEIYIYTKNTSNFQYYKYATQNASMSWIAEGRWE